MLTSGVPPCRYTKNEGQDFLRANRDALVHHARLVGQNAEKLFLDRDGRHVA